MAVKKLGIIKKIPKGHKYFENLLVKKEIRIATELNGERKTETYQFSDMELELAQSLNNGLLTGGFIKFTQTEDNDNISIRAELKVSNDEIDELDRWHNAYTEMPKLDAGFEDQISVDVLIKYIKGKDESESYVVGFYNATKKIWCNSESLKIIYNIMSWKYIK